MEAATGEEAGTTMGMEVRVGPSVVTINQSTTFLVTREDGIIEAGGEFGLFAQDTRFLSHYQFGIFPGSASRQSSIAVA